MLTAVDTVYAGYASGEEVVVRLGGVEVLNADDGSIVAAAALPAWTIGEIGVVMRNRDGDRHAIFFRLEDALCVCVVGEDAIEGTA